MRDERQTDQKWTWNEKVQFTAALINIPLGLAAVIGGLMELYKALCAIWPNIGPFPH